MTIRKAVSGDEDSILELIKELAVYEKEPNAVINTSEQLAKHLFTDTICEAFVALVDEKVIGFSLFYTSYSTWKCPCIYLEDLYVRPRFRRTGGGSKLFNAVVDVAKERKVARMDWQVLGWNQLAIDFYKRKNAIIDDDWCNGRFFFND